MFFFVLFYLICLVLFLPSTILDTRLFYFYSTDITKRAVQIPLTTVAHIHVIFMCFVLVPDIGLKMAFFLLTKNACLWMFLAIFLLWQLFLFIENSTLSILLANNGSFPGNVTDDTIPKKILFNAVNIFLASVVVIVIIVMVSVVIVIWYVSARIFSNMFPNSKIANSLQLVLDESDMY